MDKVRIGIIGVGYRGMIHLQNLLQRDDVIIRAISDPNIDNLAKALSFIETRGEKKPNLYSELNGYKHLLDKEKLDGVIVSVPWHLYYPICKYALEKGIYVGVEAASAQTMEELYDLLETAQRFGGKCMLLENACYHRDVMAVMNMIKDGLFGELVHCRGGYEHDLRSIKFSPEMEFGAGTQSEAAWRTEHSVRRNGDLYPTHGVGPIAQLLDINRGNRFISLSSYSTKSVGLNRYVAKHQGGQHENAKRKFRLGDVVTTTLTTAKGETVVLTHNTNVARPYSLGFRVQGTDGIWIQENGNHLYLEHFGEDNIWHADSKQLLEQFDHNLWQRFGLAAAKTVRHEMDYFVLKEFVEAIQEEREPRFDIYDMVTWLSITPLSERSIEQDNAKVAFPDFTEGKWQERISFYKEPSLTY
ncbi:Gfo/Idh/MocA family oxidoreductase [Limibacter armeniacum]|uniref:Gfo/Idh/MocA family protein n=1 Tax=Limibacter armeniacum TaxID=466084 RepID=UPI002FE534DE